MSTTPQDSATPATTDLLTIPEVAEHLRCSRDTVERRIKAGALPVVRNGRRRLVPRADVEAFVARNTERVA